MIGYALGLLFRAGLLLVGLFVLVLASTGRG